MNQTTWTEVDCYLAGLFTPHDPELEAALRAAEKAGLPPIQVSSTQGKLLSILARSIQARRILEIGTLGGYSAIWLARALPPSGQLVTIEADPKHAKVARVCIDRAGLTGRVEVRLGQAAKLLPKLAAEGGAPFDLVFIDADKTGIPDYFAWALKLTRPGSLIVVDNVIRNGAVADAGSGDPSVLGVRRFNQIVAAEPRVSATAIQTVGSKGYDGFAVVLVLQKITKRKPPASH